jgi:cytochrome b
MKVWDRPVRALHWALVGSVALAALSTVVWFGAHRPAGYAALAIVVARIAWGVVGTRYARFSQFVRGPRALAAYLAQTMRRREPRHLGHNPLGACMVIALMACIAALAFTGWLYTTDAYWGDALVEDLHRALAWTLLGLVCMHVAGVIFASVRHRENLVASMIDGIKREPSDHDVR